MTNDDLILIAGAGGFIGGAMTAQFRRLGYRRIRAVDIKPFGEWYQRFDDVENLSLDLALKENCKRAADGAATAYCFAANMGGMGFIENNKALCMLSVLINTHLLQAAQTAGVQRYFYASSACVYNGDKQRDVHNPGLKEEDAYPALARGRLWMGETLQRAHVPALQRRFRAVTRVARFHNVYGPYGTWDGGREKAPAAICRKVIAAKLSRQPRNRDLGQRTTDAQLHVHR